VIGNGFELKLPSRFRICREKSCQPGSDTGRAVKCSFFRRRSASTALDLSSFGHIAANNAEDEYVGAPSSVWARVRAGGVPQQLARGPGILSPPTWAGYRSEM
jgi:hypothetical protein